MISITSKDNQKIKFAGKVGAGRVANMMFAEGLRLVKEVLEANAAEIEVFLSTSFSESHREFCEKHLTDDLTVYLLPDKIFDSLAQTKTSQGILLTARKPDSGRELIAQSLVSREAQIPIVLLLHKINNPSNLGAILRTAAAARVVGVVITSQSADPFSPKALRGSMGGALKTLVWTNVEFEAAIEWANKNGLVTTCADGTAKTSYTEIDWEKPRMLIFGSEANGLTEDEFASVEDRARIPIDSNVESLNIAVSCGIILFEIKRRLGDI